MGIIKESVGEFYTSSYFRNLSPLSQSAIRPDIDRFFADPKIAELPDDEILKPETLAEYMTHPWDGEHSYSSATIMRKTFSIRRYLKFLQEIRLLSAETQIPPSPDHQRTPTVRTPLTDGQIRQLYLATEDSLRDSALVALFLGTGAKAKEIESLDTPNVVRDNGSARITFDRRYQRSVLLTGREAQKILAYREIRPDDKPLLINHLGTRLTRQGMWLILQDKGKEAGINDLNASIFRATFTARQRSGSATEIARALGLKNPSSTKYWR